MIYVIFGPTACGKTKAAKALADFFDAPIINADAFQIYKEMNIGTAKIDKNDKYYSKHYLLDVVEPNTSYNVRQYQLDFRKTLDELNKTNQNIIVCGGTGLYIRASLFDYNFPEEDNPSFPELEKLSNDELYKMLLEIDEESAKTIHVNNRKRVIRAIEFYKNNLKTKSENISNQEHKLMYKDVKFLFINPDRELLYENINRRVDQMVDNGLIDEVKQLLEKYKLSITASQAIGYKEVIDYLSGDCSLQSCIEKIKQRSRNYAKRQVTFFKHQFDYVEFSDSDELIKEVCHG